MIEKKGKEKENLEIALIPYQILDEEDEMGEVLNHSH